MKLAVLKLGGGLLTREAGRRSGVRLARLRSLAAELHGAPPLVLVHGSGAFGKPPAVAHGYMHGQLVRGTAAVVSSAAEALERLHGAVLGAVRGAGLPACSVHAAHLFDWAGGRLRLRSDEPARQMLARGVVPVVASGFVADHDGGGFAVASSDALAAGLARALGAGRLVFATHAHGVYRNFPRTDVWHECLAADDVTTLALVGPAEGDVTGGMLGKLRCGFEATRRGIATCVVDGRKPGNVAAALRGDPFVGTRLISSSGDCCGRPSGADLLLQNESTPAPIAQPDPVLERRVDALRLRIDEHMCRLFEQRAMAGPLAADPLNWHDPLDRAGQAKDVVFESSDLLSSQACLDNAWRETGRLFEICARIGAILAGATQERQRAAALRAGNAGVAVQAQEDLEGIEPHS